MATYFQDLTVVFYNALQAFSQANAVNYAFENVNTPTSTDKAFLAGYVLLADTEQADLFWTERRAGVFQIDINVASSKGSTQINQLADKLNEAFKAANTFSRNDICAEVQSVSLGPLIVENGWAKRPISINFVAYTQRL